MREGPSVGPRGSSENRSCSGIETRESSLKLASDRTPRLEPGLAARQILHQSVVKPHAGVEFDEVRPHALAFRPIGFPKIFNCLKIVPLDRLGIDNQILTRLCEIPSRSNCR